MSFESHFISDDVKLGVTYILHWFDYCQESILERKYNETIESLKNKTRVITSQSPLPPPFESLKIIMKKYSIPFHYPLEYLEGLRTRSQAQQLQELSDLDQYCYRNMSSIGLMICHVMGITSQRALKFVKNIGIAIELIRVANDLRDNLQSGFSLIPQELLNKYQFGKRKKSLKFITQEIVGRAENYFQASERIYEYLPFRTGLILHYNIALYQEIGRKLITKYPDKRIKLSVIQRSFIFMKSNINYIRKRLALRMKNRPFIGFYKIVRFEEK